MRHLVVGTAGHIDHGKSSLVHALTGIDPDRLKEEKERGITIELGFAHARIGDLTVAFVDVPGHERFVKTMLAGVGGLDCIMLVVAADESVMPQTREHFDICRLLQVRHGLVVLTKADLVDEETLELVRLEVRELIDGSFLEGAPAIAVSARTGAGLDELRAALAHIGGATSARRADGAARLPIDRAFTMQGFGTVVTGTLVNGTISTEDELLLLPSEQRVRVRGLQVHGAKQTRALAGQRTAVNLGGVEIADVTRGETLAAPGSLTTTRRVDAAFDLLPTARPLRHGARVRFHQGTSELLGRVSIAAGAREGEIQPGARAFVRLRLESPAALTRGDRFILRAYSPPVTIGGGEVLDPEPPRSGVRTAAGVERFRAIADSNVRAVAQMIRDRAGLGLPLVALVSRAGLAPPDVDAFVRTLQGEGLARRVGDLLVAPSLLADAARQVIALVEEFHRAHPLTDGVPREEARERVLPRAHAAVFEAVLADLAAANKLVVRDRLARPGHQLSLSPEEARARDAVERAYRDGGLRPPDVATVATDARIPPAVAEKMLALLVRQKRLIRVDTLVFHAEALDALKSEIRALKAATADRATVDVATFKDRYGVTRKFAIPLLEWLDRERVTRRVGETRVVL
jgi:selenocysteine-specific elongation factor